VLVDIEARRLDITLEEGWTAVGWFTATPSSLSENPEKSLDNQSESAYVVVIHVITRRSTMLTLKLTAIGDSVGVILPREALTALKLEKGDTVYLTESPDGYRLTPYDPRFAQQMTLARQIMRKRRNVLRELAK
jgi:putative addiction module antidote